MATPFNPFAGRGQRGGATGAPGATGRGRGANAGHSSGFVPRGSSAPRAGRARGRGRGSATWTARGRGRGAANGTLNGVHKPGEGTAPIAATSPFAQLNKQKAAISPFGGQQSPFSGTPNGTLSSGLTNQPTQIKPVNPFSKPIGKTSFSQNSVNMASPSPASMHDGTPPAAVPVENASTLNSYQERYDQLKIARATERQQAIHNGQMADPDQPTSLNQAITPVGTCTSMCPEFESVERIVQKMVDKCEKYMHPSTNQLQNMETKMLKRFRRSAAGYDEQLPSDIRTPETLLQTMNYLMRHVINGKEPLAIIHKFVWDRTRSIRNDFSVQQLTQEKDVRVAVTCLERIARFHIVSLHLLSSPANTEPFDHHQEREQLNNTMLSLMYYYDDNRGRINFANEPEFRAYYILFSIHDQRPDLEARAQKWPVELLASPRVQVALELFAAAGNTWEPQGALDARRPNAIAQGFYTRFFNIINSPSVSYLMACVAEVYFNHVRQTAIRSIWKAYCRTPQSQQSKNDHWTLDELTKVLHFDDDQQTEDFCKAQDLQFAKGGQGNIYLNWGDRHVDNVDFAPSSDHSFSETYVESKRAGRSLVAIILGMNIKQAARMGMVDRNQLAARQADSIKVDSSDGDLFVSDVGNQTPAPVVEANPPNPFAEPSPAIAISDTTEEPKSTSFTPFPQMTGSTFQASSGFSGLTPKDTAGNPFFKQNFTDTPPKPSQSVFAPLSNPFAKPSGQASPVTTGAAAPSPLGASFPRPATGEKQPSIFPTPGGHSSSSLTTPTLFASTPSAVPTAPVAFPTAKAPQSAAAAPPSLFQSSSPHVPSLVATDTPTTAPASSSVFTPNFNTSGSSSPFSFTKPPETAKPSDAPAAPLAEQSPAVSTLFKPSSSSPAPSATKNPFETLPSFGSGEYSKPFVFPKAPVTNQDLKTTAASTSTTQSVLSDPGNKPNGTLATPKNPFGFSQLSYPAPPAASSPFSFTTVPEAIQPKNNDTGEKKVELFSFSSANNPPPKQASIFAPLKALEHDQKPETPAPTVPTAEKQPPVFSQPPTSPKSSQVSIFRSSAPAHVEVPEILSSGTSAFKSDFQPARAPPSPAALPASRSVSSIHHPAHSPPRTLFEALRQPKIFDAKSSAYLPFQSAVTQQPLFKDTAPSVESNRQDSLKRPHATDPDASQQHKRRSSLKGKSEAVTSNKSLRRSVHFDEELHEHKPASSKKSRVSSEHQQSQPLQKKRPIDEQTEVLSEEQCPSSKLTKVSTPEEHTPFKFSVYKAENRPLPKLPILEKLEKKLADTDALCEPRRLSDEQLQYIEEQRLRRARQVDEDEIALSRARILAEKLKNGPGIFDGWTPPPRKPWDDPNWNPVTSVLEKYPPRILDHDPKPLPPKLILTRTPSNAYEVAYAPDTPNRPMSRTERRIRHTGAHGLAHVPLDFQRRRREPPKVTADQQKTPSKNVNGKKNGDANNGPSGV